MRKRTCSKRCQNAKGKRCRCVCQGATHGKGMTQNSYIEQKELALEVANF